MLGVRAQVAFALVRGRDQCSPPAEVEDDVAVGYGPVLRWAQSKRPASARLDLLQGLEPDGEAAKRAVDCAYGAHHTIKAAIGRDQVRVIDQNRHSQRVAQHSGSLDGC